MKYIEVLYPEFSNLYADLKNIEYLEKCNKDIKVIYTHVSDEPYFINHKVDMIYMGSMSDNKIEACIKILSVYKKQLQDLIDSDVLFLITGNALEVFSSYIEVNNKKIDGLNIFDYYIEKDMKHKHASWYIGEYDKIDIVGNRNQFARCYGINHKFIKTIGGYGIDLERDSDNEGINYKNFYATYLLGPLLILNPLFTKFILRKLGLKDKLFMEEDIMNAYNRRKDHFKKKGVRFDMGQYG